MPGSTLQTELAGAGREAGRTAVATVVLACIIIIIISRFV